MTDRTRILLGEIINVKGLKGDVVVRSYAEVPEDIAAYGALQNERGTQIFALKVREVTARGVVAAVEGVSDRTSAEKLKGTKLYVERSKLPPAESGAFYHADLIGLKAVSPEGTDVGTIVAVENYGAGDLLEIKLASTGKTELIPFRDPFVPKVDLEARTVTVALPDYVEAEAEEKTDN